MGCPEGGEEKLKLVLTLGGRVTATAVHTQGTQEDKWGRRARRRRVKSQARGCQQACEVPTGHENMDLGVGGVLRFHLFIPQW